MMKKIDGRKNLSAWRKLCPLILSYPYIFFALNFVVLSEENRLFYTIRKDATNKTNEQNEENNFFIT